jgi:hypothetical protein
MGKIEIDHTGSGGGITLSSDGTNLLVGGSAVGGGDVVDDTSPQLGGALQLNGNNIQGNDSTGVTQNRIQLGTSQDLEFYHDGTNSYITNSTGYLIIENSSAARDVFLKSDNGSGGTNTYIGLEGGDTYLYGNYGTSLKFKTGSLGNTNYGTFYSSGKITANQGIDFQGNSNLDMGDSTNSLNNRIKFGTGDDFQLYHNGLYSVINNTTGSLQLQSDTSIELKNAANTENYLVATANGAVTIFYDNSAKLATTSTGIAVTGNATFADNGKAIFGAGSDLQIFHDGTNSYIKDAGTGVITIQSNQVRIQNAAGTEDVAFFNQDGDVKLYYDSSVKLATTSTGIDVTGNITVSGTVDGRDITTDGTKLDGIEASADVTDTANVTAAGALMDSELTNLAAVKAIDQGLTTSSNVQFNNVTVDGNLTVGGTTTTINSTTVTVDDPIFTLGGDTAPASDDNKDRGIEFRWHNGAAAKVGFFGFDDSVGKFTFIPDATNTSEVFTGTAGTIVADLEGTIQTAAQTNITSLGTLTSLTTSADASLNGITVGNQTIFRPNGNLKLVGGGSQNTRNLIYLSNGTGATIYGGSASTNATLRSTYGITIDGGDGDVDITGNTAVTGNITVSGTVAGTGSLELRGSAIYLKNAAGTETGISFEQNNNVVLNFDNQSRLTTTLSGITIDGFVRHNGGTSGGIEGISGSTLTYRNYTTRTLVSSTSPSQIVSVPYTGASVNFRSIEATIQVKNTSTGAREIQKVMATTDGTNAYVTNYGEVSTTGSSLADFTVDLLSSNLRILATQGSTTQHEYKVHAILFTD